MKANKQTYKLPEGWVLTNVSDLFAIIGGGTPTKNNSRYWDGEINWASVKDMKSQYISTTIDKITKEGVDNSNAKTAEIDDLILVTRISPGKVSIVKSKTAINQDLKILKLFGGINPLFVYYLLKSQNQQFIAHSSGTTVKGLKVSDLINIRLPFPPFNEQQRIVSKIESLFSELDQAEKGLKIAQQQLDVYRHAILKYTFEGRETKKLETFTEIITKGASPKWQGINYTSDEEVLFVTSENVQNNSMVFDNKKYVENKFNEKQKRSILKKGDVLVNIVGASIGRAAIFNLDANANINQAVSLIRLKKLVEPKFISYYLNSPLANDYYQNRIVDVARANLSLKDISEIPIPIFTQTEQQAILDELESRFTLIDNLEKTIINSLKDITLFKYSILKKAFDGKLIAQDNTDEPANLLLQKIRIEKSEYLKIQKEFDKHKPQKKRQMEKKKTVLEILSESKEPISTEELWTNSIHEGDIEGFYSEIKEIFDQLSEDKKSTESFLSIKK